ncbi:MAG: four helix bundle protein [Alphaproteobacteria bacterium]|nr:four helix bundle protein [Alphaproteobacteria bacterium]
MVQNYGDLLVWQKEMQLAENIFGATEQFPGSQRYVLVSQMQRCAHSVPSNIAEGRSRHSEKDFTYHLNVARGSLAELETHIILSQRLGFITDVIAAQLLNQCNEVTRMLFGLRDSLKGNYCAEQEAHETYSAEYTDLH